MSEANESPKIASKLILANLILNMAIIILFLMLGFFAIASSDDYWHAFYINNGHPKFLSPFYWIYGQYLHWTGRIIVSFYQSIFIFNPPLTHYSSLVNVSLFLATFYIEFNQQFNKENSSIDRFKKYLPALILLFFAISHSILGESIFWMSSVYPFPLFIFVIFKKFINNDFQFNKKLNWIFWVWAFILGNSLELLIVPGFYLIIKNIINNKNSQKQNSNLYNVLFFFTIGVLTSLLAPGNFYHLDSASHNFNLTTLPFNFIIIYKKAISLLIKNYLFILLCILIIPQHSKKDALTVKGKIKVNLTLAFTSLFFLIPIYGFNSDRTYIYFAFFVTFAIFHFITFLKYKVLSKKFEFIEQLLICPLQCALIVFLLLNINDAFYIKKSFIYQQNEILLKKQISKKVVVKKLIRPMSGHILYYTDLTLDKNAWPNVAQAKFYNLESLTAY
jgi:hypothetical protein